MSIPFITVRPMKSVYQNSNEFLAKRRSNAYLNSPVPRNVRLIAFIKSALLKQTWVS